MSDRIDFNLPPIKRRERPFEYRLRDALKLRGIMFIKLKPTIEGFPDRLAIGPGDRIAPAKTALIETKIDVGGSLSPTQEIVHRDLTRRGVVVLVIPGPDLGPAIQAIVKAVS